MGQLNTLFLNYFFLTILMHIIYINNNPKNIFLGLKVLDKKDYKILEYFGAFVYHHCCFYEVDDDDK